jgi:serine/threonine protein kinase
VVHEGTWRGAPVAVKRLRGADAASLASLAAEVAALAGRRHPRLVTLLGACLDPAHACLVVELVPGGSLAARVTGVPPDRAGPGGGLPYGAVLRVGADVAAALAALHPTVVHRDVKPSNVLVAPVRGKREERGVRIPGHQIKNDGS